MAVIDVHAYCRDVEAHLCRRNGGHLIRVVGPAFEVVKAWAEEGVPLSVAHAGIDRTVDRAARRATRRRPLPIEFCDADVRDAFDDWRRAVGTSAPGPRAAAAGGGPAPKRERLSTHVERVAVQLTAARVAGRLPPVLQPALDVASDAVARLHDASRGARGSARDRVIAELAEVDAALVAAALGALEPGDRAACEREARTELEPFRTRLDPARWEAAVSTATARLVRLRWGLPVVAFDV